MTVHIVKIQEKHSRPVWLVREDPQNIEALPPAAQAWLQAQNFEGREGEFTLLPAGNSEIGGAALGVGKGDNPFAAGALAKMLPEGAWHFENAADVDHLALLGAMLGGYQFNRYRAENTEKNVTLTVPAHLDDQELSRQWQAVVLARDLINTPANDMLPDALEWAVGSVARRYKADFAVTAGDDLLRDNLPLVHAVGRAGAVAPRLLDMRWGREDAPKVTLVGKGVCFDTGGLDIKSASGMLLMKKDMGGAANVLALAQMIMDAKLPVRLRLLVPAVENAIAGNAFRPGDILPGRKGLHIEIGNTDAEGRLVLADALALGDEEAPELMLDMATLTGAARIALGPDLPPFFTADEALAARVIHHAAAQCDPLWRLPLWQPYMKRLASRVADINKTTNDGQAGSVTAALFLSRFVEKAGAWAHFDIYGWTPVERPGFPVGGEAQGIRALYALVQEKYGK
ncbi:MAG: Cytosol aminopeptidase [Candidatus Tokpelaia hoelldobleri]|uniref:Cytosol aminopeptidase n=1 Tax=Candidatus Tokpelaia hoelldobleri TaxID=1902579 RepID=A0A1U9JVL4_9HYPH|nr:MAG: Cytosol aminopeptidase [Candidatus Tokpelaia hoelldoblerii]